MYWNDNIAFQANSKKVKSIVSINDIAERGVKLSSDFLES